MRYFYVLIALLFGMISCRKEDENAEPREMASVNLKMGSELVLTKSASGDCAELGGYPWQGGGIVVSSYDVDTGNDISVYLFFYDMSHLVIGEEIPVRPTYPNPFFSVYLHKDAVFWSTDEIEGSGSLVLRSFDNVKGLVSFDVNFTASDGANFTGEIADFSASFDNVPIYASESEFYNCEFFSPGFYL